MAPLAFKVADAPLQIVAKGAADNVSVGNGLTDTVTLAVLSQPLASVPVTVNTVLMVGVALVTEPVLLPGNQV